MKKFLALCFSIFITLSVQAQSSSWVFILSGQSNMVGQGVTSELGDAMKTVPENVEFYLLGRKSDFSRQSTFGPEVTFAHEISKVFPEQKILLVKYAVGGTSLYAWSPEWSREIAEITQNADKGRLYESLMRYIQRSLEGKNYAYKGILWMQGERDARYAAAGPAYAENIRHLIRTLREDLNSPHLPFIYGIVNPPPANYPAVDDVRAAQRELEQTFPFTKMVNTDDLSKKSDNLHYDTAAQIELGKRFAEAYLELIKSGTDRLMNLQ